MVKSYGLTLLLKNDPALIEQYKEYHKKVWPEVLRALQTVGVLHMKIYLLGTRMFMYLETVDEFVPEVDLPRHMELSPRCVEWGNLMKSFQEKVPEAKEHEWWAYMEQVFDLSEQLQQLTE